MLSLVLKHLFFIPYVGCLCSRTVDVLTSQGNSPEPRPHNPHIPHYKTKPLFWWNFFHWNMPSPLAQVLCYAKHVLLFWNVGSLMSINTSNAEERLLWSWSVRAAFGGVIVLGNGEKVQTVFWAGNLLVERNQMIKPVQSVFAPWSNTSREYLRTLVTADLCEYLLG